jgi:hypothetical protein
VVRAFGGEDEDEDRSQECQTNDGCDESRVDFACCDVGFLHRTKGWTDEADGVDGGAVGSRDGVDVGYDGGEDIWILGKGFDADFGGVGVYSTTSCEEVNQRPV